MKQINKSDVDKLVNAATLILNPSNSEQGTHPQAMPTQDDNVAIFSEREIISGDELSCLNRLGNVVSVDTYSSSDNKSYIRMNITPNSSTRRAEVEKNLQRMANAVLGSSSVEVDGANSDNEYDLILNAWSITPQQLDAIRHFVEVGEIKAEGGNIVLRVRTR